VRGEDFNGILMGECSFWLIVGRGEFPEISKWKIKGKIHLD
jgi:hypothetical protein